MRVYQHFEHPVAPCELPVITFVTYTYRLELAIVIIARAVLNGPHGWFHCEQPSFSHPSSSNSEKVFNTG